MNVSVVTCIPVIGTSPIVTVWDNRDAAEAHYEYEKKQRDKYKHICLDYDVPVYQVFSSSDDNKRFLMWRKQ